MNFSVGSLEGDEEPSGGKLLGLIQTHLTTPSLAEIRFGRQANSGHRGSPDSALQAPCPPTVEMSIAKVTAALLLPLNARTQTVSIADMNTETTNSMLVRVSRFFSDRYAYRVQPDYLSELAAFGTIVFIAVWPIILAAHAMAVALK